MAMHWSEKTAKLLGMRRWSHRDLAEALGLPSSTVNKWFGTRGTEPGVTVGVRIARVLEVPAGWLFDADKDWPPEAWSVTQVPAEGLEQTIRVVVLRVLGELAAREAQPGRGSDDSTHTGQ